MATIRKDAVILVSPELAWDALRDVGAVHTRLAAGFVIDCRMDGEAARIVTFADGLAGREVIVTIGDADRRIAWSATGGRLTHHNASAQVFAQGDGRTRFV